MYNPAGMANGFYQSGLFGGTTAPTVTYEPDPVILPQINFTLPGIKIAPDNSVPKPSGGPVPGNDKSWWDTAKEAMQNVALWFGQGAETVMNGAEDLANDAAVLFTGDPVIEKPAPPATKTDTNSTALLLAGAAVFILWKSSRG